METQSTMICYTNRLNTMLHWCFSAEDGATCTAEKMAEVGFYCPNPDKEPDSVQCFLCGKELDGWKPDDSPLDEHRSHSSDCHFLKIGCKNEQDMTVKEYTQTQTRIQLNFLNLEKERMQKKMDNAMEEKKKTIHKVKY